MTWRFLQRPAGNAPGFAKSPGFIHRNNRDEDKKPGLKNVVGSVLSAAFGVQSSKNRERDFKHGKARVFIVTGIVFTVLFIATVFLVVKLVLTQAGT